MTHPIPKIGRLATREEEVEEEEGTDERIASEELLWRRMEDNIETAFTFSNSSNRSTSAAYRPSRCRKEAKGTLENLSHLATDHVLTFPRGESTICPTCP